MTDKTALEEVAAEAKALHELLRSQDWYDLAGTDAERRLHERLTALVSCDEFPQILAPPAGVGEDDGVGQLVERLSGPHEWGYRCITEGDFLHDNTPFEAADELSRLSAELAGVRRYAEMGEACERNGLASFHEDGELRFQAPHDAIEEYVLTYKNGPAEYERKRALAAEAALEVARAESARLPAPPGWPGSTPYVDLPDPPVDPNEAAFRKVGFTGAAINYPLSPEAFAWLCEFNGTTTDKAPWQWGYAPNEYMQRYLDRRASEAVAKIGVTP